MPDGRRRTSAPSTSSSGWSTPGAEANPNLDFVLDDAARTVQALRGEGKRVLLHCVEGRSRTPSVAARYSLLLGKDPDEVLKVMTWSHPDRDLWRAAVRRKRVLTTTDGQLRPDPAGGTFPIA